jgi:hypothetical protein
MTGKAAGTPSLDPDSLELAPGTRHENLEGWAPVLGSDAEVLDALEKAFDYRGDVTITCKDGSVIEGYIFDRKTRPSLAESWVQLFPKDSPDKRSVPYSDIAGLTFSGKDRAAGASWEAWIKKWNEKKAAGEKGFGLHPESLE